MFEFMILGLFMGIGFCFGYLIYVTKPDWTLVARGFLPSMLGPRQLYVAMGIIGATVMPHNLYLHSSIVKSRASRSAAFGEIRMNDDSEDIEDDDYVTEYSSPIHDQHHSLTHTYTNGSGDVETPLLHQGHWTRAMVHQAVHFSSLDSFTALTLALLINSAILIVSGTAFYGKGAEMTGELPEAYNFLVQRIGPYAGYAFAVALLFAGQSSTITGTLAGQICMQGFLGSKFRLKPWMRRLLTRSLAILPAMAAAVFKGEHGISDLLVFSQVLLSLQLPFAVWPLVIYTSSQGFMSIAYEDGVEHFANRGWLKASAYVIAILITAFNAVLIYQAAFL